MSNKKGSINVRYPKFMKNGVFIPFESLKNEYVIKFLADLIAYADDPTKLVINVDLMYPVSPKKVDEFLEKVTITEFEKRIFRDWKEIYKSYHPAYADPSPRKDDYSTIPDSVISTSSIIDDINESVISIPSKKEEEKEEKKEEKELPQVEVIDGDLASFLDSIVSSPDDDDDIGEYDTEYTSLPDWLNEIVNTIGDPNDVDAVDDKLDVIRAYLRNRKIIGDEDVLKSKIETMVDRKKRTYRWRSQSYGNYGYFDGYSTTSSYSHGYKSYNKPKGKIKYVSSPKLPKTYPEFSRFISSHGVKLTKREKKRAKEVYSVIIEIDEIPSYEKMAFAVYMGAKGMAKKKRVRDYFGFTQRDMDVYKSIYDRYRNKQREESEEGEGEEIEGEGEEEGEKEGGEDTLADDSEVSEGEEGAISIIDAEILTPREIDEVLQSSDPKEKTYWTFEEKEKESEDEKVTADSKEDESKVPEAWLANRYADLEWEVKRGHSKFFTIDGADFPAISYSIVVYVTYNYFANQFIGRIHSLYISESADSIAELKAIIIDRIKEKIEDYKNGLLTEDEKKALEGYINNDVLASL